MSFKIKRLTALTMSLMMLLCMSFPGGAVASETIEDVVNIVFSEDFESDTPAIKLNTGSSTASNLFSYEEYPYDNNPVYKNALKFDYSSIASGGVWCDFISSDGNAVLVNPENTKDLYVEISLDISISSTGNTPFYMYLQGINAGGNSTEFAYLHWNNGRVYARTSAGPQQISNYSANTMYNVKWVQHWTGSEGETKQTTTAVYINGNLAAHQSYPFPQELGGIVSTFNGIRFMGRANVFWVDNLSCITYSSEDGVSPVARRKVELKNKIKNLNEFIELNSESIREGYLDELYVSLDKSIEL